MQHAARLCVAFLSVLTPMPLAGQEATLRSTLDHKGRGRIACLAFCRDGKTIATGEIGEGQSLVRLWNVATGKNTSTLAGHVFGVYFLQFSADGKTLASASADAPAQFWDVATGKKAVAIPKAGSPVAFSPDGSSFATQVGDVVHVWQVGTGKQSATIKVPGGHFDPEWKRSAAVRGKVIELWDVPGEKRFATLVGHTDQILAVAFSVDSKTIASGGKDQTIRLWNATTGECTATLRQGAHEAAYLNFSPDGTLLASGSWHDNTIKLWDVAKGMNTATLPWQESGLLNGLHGIAFSPTGRILAACGNSKVRLWDVPATRR